MANDLKLMNVRMSETDLVLAKRAAESLAISLSAWFRMTVRREARRQLARAEKEAA